MGIDDGCVADDDDDDEEEEEEEEEGDGAGKEKISEEMKARMENIYLLQIVRNGIV